MQLPLTCAALSLLSLSFTLPQSNAEEAWLPALAGNTERSESIEAVARATRSTGAGYTMQSTASALVAHFDGRGMEVIQTKTAGAANSQRWSWGLELASYGFPGSELAVDQPVDVEAAGSRLTYHWGAGLEEWYVNQARGLEHGFTLAQRPAGADPGELLGFDLRVRGELIAQVKGAGRDVRFHLSSGEAAISYDGLVVFDANGTEFPARFSAAGDHLQLTIDEAGATYPLTIDPVIQKEYVKASNAGDHDAFGNAIAISGDTAVVGAWLEDGNAAGVNGDQANNQASDAGAVYVFVKQGDSWTQQAYLKASNPGVDDYFGVDVAIDGDTVVVGAFGEASSATGVGGNPLSNSKYRAGAAYVFVRTGSTWSQQAYLKASNTDTADYFGRSVAISGDRMVVGAPREDGGGAGVGADDSDNSMEQAGAAYLYTRTGGTWGAPVYLKAASPGAFDYFGYDVAIEGTRVLVGAHSEDSAALGVNGDAQDNSAIGAGAGYLFEWVDDQWTQVAYLKASNTQADDRLGWAVDLDGDQLVLGAIGEDGAHPGVNVAQDDNSASGSGAAYVFVKQGGVWSQVAYIKASNPKASDQFGHALALDGERLVISAIGEAGSSTGVNGDEYDLGTYDAGATFVYKRAAGSWSQTDYIKSTAVDAYDGAGSSVALADGVLWIGVDGEDSGSTGLGGDPFDNSELGAGAAYVYDLEANCGATMYGPWTGSNVAHLGMTDAAVAGGVAKLEMWGFSGDGLATLLISTAPSNLPFMGGTVLVDFNHNVFGPGGFVSIGVTSGSGLAMFPLPPALAGQSFYCQAAMADPLLPNALALTNGLEVTVCP